MVHFLSQVPDFKAFQAIDRGRSRRVSRAARRDHLFIIRDVFRKNRSHDNMAVPQQETPYSPLRLLRVCALIVSYIRCAPAAVRSTFPLAPKATTYNPGGYKGKMDYEFRDKRLFP